MTNFGGYLKVPSVQELAKQKPESVPSQYVRHDQDHPFLDLNDASSSQEIPVIDMQKLVSEENIVNTELEKLHMACQEWGFFQLINHGVSSQLLEKVEFETQEFLNLPIEEKEKFARKEGDAEGFGQALVFSEQQKLDWADILYMVTLPSEMRKPHLFPKLPLSFRETLEVYSVEVNNLAMNILKQIAKALGMKLEDMTMFLENGQQSMRINNYPPCPQPELAIGLAAHSDPGGLTILLQVGETEGLQIIKDGLWTPVAPLPNSFIVNIGDILEIITNGIYKSVEHRATVNSGNARVSLATFHSPKPLGDVGPAPSLITPEIPAKFKRISLVEYYTRTFSRELRSKSNLDAMRI